MKLYTNMPEKLKPFYRLELQKATTALAHQQWRLCWHHLERAHILAQAYPVEHTNVHWRMLCFGIRIKNVREVLGQLPRLFFGGVKSFVGNIPVGNTGGSNVPALKRMAIPDDIAHIMNSDES